MACLTLLFVVILTTVSKVTSLHCSDQQLPASGDDDLQKVTILQYCLVDNCTITMINTGEKLDIVYTTDSLIITTPKDGHTSVVIAKQENEPACFKPSSIFEDRQFHIAGVVMHSILLVVNGYTIAIHAVFKELRNLFGKLIMLNSATVICFSITYIGLLVGWLQLAAHSLLSCYLS